MQRALRTILTISLAALLAGLVSGCLWWRQGWSDHRFGSHCSAHDHGHFRPGRHCDRAHCAHHPHRRHPVPFQADLGECGAAFAAGVAHLDRAVDVTDRDRDGSHVVPDIDEFLLANQAASANPDDPGTLFVPQGRYAIPNKCSDDPTYCSTRPCECVDGNLRFQIYAAYLAEKGAILDLDPKVVIEFRGEILSGPWQIWNEGADAKCQLDASPRQKIDRIYAEWWGAETGGGDDTYSLQRALEEASPSAPLVSLPSSYHVCALTIERTNVTWLGTGSFGANIGDTGMTTIARSGDCASLSAPLVAVRNTSGVVIRDVGFYGAAATPASPSTGEDPFACVELEDANWVTLDGVESDYCAGDGIRLDRSNHALLDGIVARYNARAGVHLRTGGGNVVLVHPDLEDNGEFGVLLEQTSAEENEQLGTVNLTAPWFEDNPVALVNDSKSCLDIRSGRESGGDMSRGVVLTANARCTTIEGMELRVGRPSSWQGVGLEIDAGATGTVLINLGRTRVSGCAEPSCLFISRDASGQISVGP